jgi:uncharacterized protein DUF3800
MEPHISACKNWKHIFMQLTAYGDEAGTHSSSKKTVIAMLVGSVQQWDAHHRDWTALLKRYRLDHLHAADLFNRKKAFSGWKPNDIAKLVVAANDITERNILFGVVSVLTNDDYVMVYRRGGRLRKIGLDSKYGLCFRYGLSNIISFLRGHHGEDHTLDVMMEAGDPNIGASRTIFAQIKNVGDEYTLNLLRTVSDGAKKAFTGLQAADLIAYPSYKIETAYSVTTLDARVEDVGAVKSVRCPILRASMTAGALAEHKEDLPILDQFREQFGVTQ